MGCGAATYHTDGPTPWVDMQREKESTVIRTPRKFFHRPTPCPAATDGSMLSRMSNRTLSPRQLAELAKLAATPALKAKASVTLSGNLLRVIDTLAGAEQRSAWIERAVRAYAKRELKGRRRDRELELLNRHAKELNAEGNDSAAYQAAWDPE
jgi:hypothetical protein